MQRIFDTLASQGSYRTDVVEQMRTRVGGASAREGEAQAELERARLQYAAEIEGVNTTVANVEAQLKLARYYLENTTLVAPEDGRIVNLQVRPGMVSGIYRIGGIAALIADADRYLLATFYQENLKWVRPGQPVEISLDLYPGQIFAGKVDSIWRANGIAISPERRDPQIPATTPEHSTRSVRREDPSGWSRPIKVSHRCARHRGHLHRRRTRCLGCAAQNLDPSAFLDELALSDEFLGR